MRFRVDAFFAFFVVKHRSLIQKNVIVTHDVLPLNTNQAIAIVRPVSTELINIKYVVFALHAPQLG